MVKCRCIFAFIAMALLSAMTVAAWAMPNRDKLGAAVEPPEAMAPGAQAVLKLKLTMAHGFHVNVDAAQNPVGMPLTLSLEADKAMELVSVAYPKAQLIEMAFAQQAVPVFEGVADLELTVQVAPTAAPGAHQAKVVIDYQGCDAGMCYMPQSLEVPFSFEVK